VTGLGEPQVFETSRLSRILDCRLIDGGEVISFRRRQLFTLTKIPGNHLYWRLRRPQGHRTVGSIRSTEKSDMARKRDRACRLESSVGGFRDRFYERGNEYSCSIKRTEFFDLLRKQDFLDVMCCVDLTAGFGSYIVIFNGA
jgi:hypothetical protein